MKWLSGAIAVGTFAVLYLLENKRPLRRQIEPKEIETVRNLAIASLSAVVLNYLEKPVTDKLTKYVEEKNFGLLKMFRLPKFVETVLSVVLLDYTLYLWHVLTHKLSFLWRFHKIHHADLDLTVSTAVRFHFGEIAISVLFRAGQILIIGVSPNALQIWQTLLLTSIFFHHSNIKLPKDFEEKLEKLMMTPRLHGIHHSAEEAEMNSNWSSGLTVWDFLHGTFLSDVAQKEITIGVKDLLGAEKVTLEKMLVAPFLNDKKMERPISLNQAFPYKN
jgi:sterol desaturase/sphingolipid hydroxylase (fatty acid hydroxylase superfamily)